MHRHWLFLARLPHQHPDSAHRIRNVETAVAEHKCITIRIIAALYSFISPSVYSRCFTGNANSNAVVYRKCRNTTTIFSVCSFFSTIFSTVFYGFLRWIEKLSRIAYFSLHPTINSQWSFCFSAFVRSQNIRKMLRKLRFRRGAANAGDESMMSLAEWIAASFIFSLHFFYVFVRWE